MNINNLKIHSFLCVVSLFIFTVRVGAQSPHSTPDNIGSGNCLSFPGTAVNTTDYVNCGTNASLNITGSITTSCWVKKNGTSALGAPALSRMVSKDRTHNDRQWELSYDDVNNIFSFTVYRTDNTPFRVSSPTAFTSNQWYHVTGTYNQTSGIISLYINGELSISSTIGSFSIMSRPSLPVVIGAYWANAGYTQVRGKTNADIDEVSIWNRALSQTEIRDRMCSSLNVGSETGLVGYWNMNDASSTSDTNVIDNSGNGNSGTLF